VRRAAPITASRPSPLHAGADVIRREPGPSFRGRCMLRIGTCVAEHPAIIPYDPHRGAADLGRLWVLKKGKQELSLYLHTHPLPGWELRLNIDGELRESKTVRTQDAIFETSEQWKKKAEREGWMPTHS